MQPTENAPLTHEAVADELRARGYRWHSFRADSTRRGEDGATVYWFNGSTMGEGPGRLNKQPYGWFTLDEMLAEKFAEGCR
jgi:hypothetical protein